MTEDYDSESPEPKEDIKIDVPIGLPEVNPEIYKDVENLLFRGFLTISGEINSVSFVFKSLNQHEFSLLQFMSGIRDEFETRDRFYNTFLAHGVFLVDGDNVLLNRQENIPQLAKTFAEFPIVAKTKMVRYLSEVNDRAMRAVQLTEAYVMELSSRYRWAQLRGLDLMSPTATGIPGTNELGLNWAQLVWRALNHYDDLREQAERDWDNAKFIGSCMAGKGIQKIYNQDNERRRKEQDSKIARRDRIIRKARFGENFDDEEKNGKVTRVHAKTIEELTDQLERGLRGEKDWHDEVVESAERYQRDLHQNRRVELHKMAEERDKEYNGSMIRAATTLEGMTSEQLAVHLQRKRQEEAQKVASRMVYPEMQDPRMAEFYERHLGDSSYEPGVKTRFTKTDRDTTEVPDAEPPKPRGRPFGR